MTAQTPNELSAVLRKYGLAYPCSPIDAGTLWAAADCIDRLDNEPRLGCATTRELLQEIRARGETEHHYQDEGNMLAIGAANLLNELPGSMLDYRTVDSQ